LASEATQKSEICSRVIFKSISMNSATIRMRSAESILLSSKSTAGQLAKVLRGSQSCRAIGQSRIKKAVVRQSWLNNPRGWYVCRGW
jgi:hypothetical protein